MAVVDQLMVLFWIFFLFCVVDERANVAEERSSSVFRVIDAVA